MLNKTIKRAIRTFIFTIAIFAFHSIAANYQVNSLTANSVEISFTIDNTDKLNSATANTLFFAVTSQPSISITGHIVATNGISCTGNCIKTLSSGWMGKDFIQWLSITLRIADKYLTNDKKIGGTISLLYNKPILKTYTSQKSYNVQNCIIRLPIRKMLIKRIKVSKPFIPYTSGIRMEIPQDGIYQITGNDLKNLGLPIENILLKSYRLFCKDKEIPIFISNTHNKYIAGDDVILFYGQSLRGINHYYTQYSDINIYWLTWGSGLVGARVAKASGGLKKDPSSFDPDFSIYAAAFIDTIHIEKDNDIRWQGDIFNIEETEQTPLMDEAIDNWYWGFIGNNKLTNFTFLIPSPLKNNIQNVRLKIGLTGITSINTNPKDHQFTIQLNDKSTNSPPAIWDGQNDYVFISNPIEANRLNHGINNITFSRVQDDIIPDCAALNWIEIKYTRGFNVLNDKISFRNNKKDINRWIQFDLTGFSSGDLELWDIRNYRKFNSFKTEKVTGTYTLLFQDSIIDVSRYYAQVKNFRLIPQHMVLDTISNDWDFPTGIDYIMISTKTLIPLLQPLIEAHNQSGLKVEAIDIQDIYNRFSYGISNPESIRSMLSYVFSKNPNNPPKYLLLGGDGSHDMYKKNRYKNVIPTHLTRVPNWGPASDDGYFATVLGNDNFPDLHVGRFPARNPSDMIILVNKTVNYLLYPEHGYWKDNLILIGGVEPDFTAFNNEAVTSIIGPKMNVIRMDAYSKSPYYISGSVASNKIAGYINAGAYAINFAGHGGGNTWSDSKFFSYSDLPKLHNSQWGKSGRLPIIFSFTCLTGFFESTLYESLGENFLRQSADGCIAFYAASAYTRRDIDIQMSRTLLKNAMTGNFESLGELLSTVEILMLVTNASEALPLVRQYNLLGDPAIPWKLALDTLTLSLEDSNLKGSDTLKISGKTSPIVSGNVKLSVTAENCIPWAEIIATVSNSSFNHNFALKTTSKTANGLVRAFAWNDSTELRGWAYFSKDTFALHDVKITPSQPAYGDSVSIICRLLSKDSLYIPTILCLYTIDNPLNQNINFDDTSYVFMKKDASTDLWKSSKKFLLSSPDIEFDINKCLIIQFRSTGKLGESCFYTFSLKGRPDLTFTSDSLCCTWRNDSIYVECDILNKGNTHSPPFSVTFLGSSTTLTDTIYHGYSTDLLYPGKTTLFNFSIPDIQGTLLYTGIININHAIKEILYSNNTTTLHLIVTYADLLTPSDTLFSIGRGCNLVPVDTLSSIHRVFLFPETLKEKQPLMSASEWTPLSGDGLSSFHIYSRPLLSAADSLNWIFHPEQANAFVTENPDSGFHSGVFIYDTLFSQWRNRGGSSNTLTNTILLCTNKNGLYALGKLTDNTPPEIRVFVGGKEILYLDYAVKNKPFNIFITDSSGIASSSIQLLHNGTPLDYNYKSSVVTGENSSTAILTAYPQKMNNIDSLTVIAEDNAGNRAEKIFTYRPGENLKIRFLSCHPNPFTARPGKLVRFAYLITDVANVTLTIYTISGRKVWRWKSPAELIGYQEISWDGTTLNRRSEGLGYRIANGTYYAKLVAKNRQKEVKKIIRIAKLEGY